jgi:hypothetical protein
MLSDELIPGIVPDEALAKLSCWLLVAGNPASIDLRKDRLAIFDRPKGAL